MLTENLLTKPQDGKTSKQKRESQKPRRKSKHSYVNDY